MPVNGLKTCVIIFLIFSVLVMTSFALSFVCRCVAGKCAIYFDTKSEVEFCVGCMQCSSR